MLWCWIHSSYLVRQLPLLLDTGHLEITHKHTASNENNKGANGFFAADFPIYRPLSSCLVLTVLLYFSPLFKKLARELSCDLCT